jgi:hypothetical protein
MVMHVVEMQNRFYGLSVQDLRSIAYELAVRNGVNTYVHLAPQFLFCGARWTPPKIVNNR